MCSLSQKSLTVKQEHIVEGGNNHGCGHHLLGTGSIAATYTVKEYLKASSTIGTVISYGCPAEEAVPQKLFALEMVILTNWISIILALRYI